MSTHAFSPRDAYGGKGVPVDWAPSPSASCLRANFLE